MKRHDELAVRSPCDQRWEDMPGNHRLRHCARCDRDVLNVEHFTRAELAARTARGRVCRRVEHRPDGSIVTADPAPAPWPRRVATLTLLAATSCYTPIDGEASSVEIRPEPNPADTPAHSPPEAVPSGAPAPFFVPKEAPPSFVSKPPVAEADEDGAPPEAVTAKADEAVPVPPRPSPTASPSTVRIQSQAPHRRRPLRLVGF